MSENGISELITDDQYIQATLTLTSQMREASSEREKYKVRCVQLQEEINELHHDFEIIFAIAMEQVHNQFNEILRTKTNGEAELLPFSLDKAGYIAIFEESKELYDSFQNY